MTFIMTTTKIHTGSQYLYIVKKFYDNHKIVKKEKKSSHARCTLPTMSHEAVNEIPSIVAEMAAVSYEPENGVRDEFFSLSLNVLVFLMKELFFGKIM